MTETWSTESLYDKATELYDSFEYEVCQKFCHKILETDPTHLDALKLLSGCLLECGEVEQSKQVLELCIKLEPEEGYEKFMTLAELLEGKSALENYLQGINCIQNEVQNGKMDRKYAGALAISAYCTIAELYMTDLCFEENAESEIEQYLAAAREIDPSNNELLITTANFRLSQSNDTATIENLEATFSKWRELEIGDPSLPDYSLRYSCAKMFVEVGKYEEAIEILEGLSLENDSDCLIFYLMGWTFGLIGNVKDAKEYLETSKELYVKQDLDMPEVLEHIQQSLDTLQANSQSLHDSHESESMEH